MNTLNTYRRSLSAIAKAMLLAWITLASACGNRVNDPPELSSENLNLLLLQAVDANVIASVDRFYLATLDYQLTASAFCTQTDAQNLTLLQESWRNLSYSWYRLASYNFGPLKSNIILPEYLFIDSLRINGEDYTSTVRGAITSDLDGSHNLDQAYIDSKVFSVVGLLPLELLSFETAASGHSQLSEEVIAEYQNHTRKCDLLLGLSQRLINTAEQVEQGWNRSFNNGNSYREIFINNQLADGQQNISQLISSVQEYLDYLKKRDVVNTAGQVSGHAWHNISAAIEEIEKLLTGSEATTISIFSFMQAAGASHEVNRVKDTLQAVKQSINEENSATLNMNLGNLDGHFKRDIPDSLDVELGLNFSDGD